MGQSDGFLKYDRALPKVRDPKKRIKDYKEIYKEFPKESTIKQASRCMDCGVPFCHKGCPLGNIIPEFNEAVCNEKWDDAVRILLSTNNFPEFTGRICPAPCEASCVLGINKPPVVIEHIEKTIIERAFEQGYVKPHIPKYRTEKRVAIIGSGPAGLACAQQLNKAGHWVTIFEREDRIGGLLRYGIPDFKLEKWVIDRRLKLMKEEGILFKVNANIGGNTDPEMLMEDFDAIVICTGATQSRDLPIAGRNCGGIHFAMDFLSQQNKIIAGDTFEADSIISAKDKYVIIIGGGDTGSDCIGTSHRQGAKAVVQLELLPKPLTQRTYLDPWPQWPMILRTSSSHEEGGKRQWSVLTKEFISNTEGKVERLKVAHIEWYTDDKGKRTFKEVPGSEYEIRCDLVLLAIGFQSPEQKLLEQFGLSPDGRGNVYTNNYQTNIDKIFAAGDARRGQSLVVWAISEGREAAIAVDKFLMDKSQLESKSKSFMVVS